MKKYNFLDKIQSRKFIAFMSGTVAMFMGKLDDWVWLATVVVFVGGNTLDKFLIMKKQMSELQNISIKGDKNENESKEGLD